ncbi:hypothetical protein D3C72_2543940 [compost metagenome]
MVFPYRFLCLDLYIEFIFQNGDHVGKALIVEQQPAVFPSHCIGAVYINLFDLTGRYIVRHLLVRQQ